jgi:hypothetical protein
MLFHRDNKGRFIKPDTPKDEVVEVTTIKNERATLQGNSVIERQRQMIIKHIFQSEELAKEFYSHNFADAV